MSRFKLVGFLVLSIALTLVAAQVPRLAHAHAHAATRPAHGTLSTAQGIACSPSPWRVISSPNPSNATNYLFGVAAVSSSNIWAVGNQSGTAGFSSKSLIEHWNGSAWSAISNPDVGTAFNDLYSVAAVSSTDIWAVGNYWDQNINDLQTLAEHWNGTAWQVMATPDPTGYQDQLESVAAVSTDDVWAVGSAGATTDSALIEHWVGTSWSVVSIANAGATGYLYGVVALAANDVWAVGYYTQSGASSTQTLVEHWDGTSWNLVASPNVDTSDELTAIASISASDIWAVGTYDNQSGTISLLAEHWNGTSWSVVPTPDPAGGDVLNAVTATSSSDVWVGGNFFDSSTGNSLPYYEHWNGTAWTAVRGPSIAASTFSIDGMAAISARDVWAVGSDSPTSAPTQTLVEHYTTPMLGLPCGG